MLVFSGFSAVVAEGQKEMTLSSFNLPKNNTEFRFVNMV
jgi:hypothetical protein